MNPSSDSRESRDTRDSQRARASLEEMFSDAEVRLRNGMSQLGDWSNEISRLIENRPGSLVAGIAIAGFLTGLVLRGGAKSGTASEAGVAAGTTPNTNFSADPIIAFLSGAVAGFTVGPKLVDSARTSTRFTEGKGRLASIDRERSIP